MKTEDNWWEDPKNKDEVDRLSWWEHPENKGSISLPVSIIETDDGGYVIGSNKETEATIGKVGGTASGKTRKEAIDEYWKLLKFHYKFLNEERLNYQRWVPFKKGPWGKTGGNWFAVFGIQVYFRYGKKMKGGWYIPFTNLNISFSSYWKLYRKLKSKKLK